MESPVESQAGSKRERPPTPGAHWCVTFASAPGVAHLRRGAGNEDACLVASRLDGTLVLAVADGAGSARRAAAGSRLAVERAVALAGDTPLPIDEAGWRGWLLDILAAVRSELLSATVADLRAERVPAPDLRRRRHDYATTLLLCALGPRWLACLQLGDGAIVARTGRGLERLTRPARGAHAGETTFVTSQDYLAHTQVTLRAADDVSGLALLTDGLEPLATDLASGRPFAPFFEGLFAFNAAADTPAAVKGDGLDAFLRSERIDARTHDDKTVVLATPLATSGST